MQVKLAEPEFDDVPTRLSPCTPRELYCALLAVEQHVHYLAPAYRFCTAALESAQPVSLSGTTSSDFLQALVTLSAIDVQPEALSTYVSSWPVRVVREFAPVGLTDGVWLQGAIRANLVENDVGMATLTQLMIRSGDPGTRESYVHRYMALLHSVGVAPARITRHEFDESGTCTDISYEHGLLGLSLGLFPQSFEAELIGFNFWMTEVGPCPLLLQLADALRVRNACTRYFDCPERDRLRQCAREATLAYLDARPTADTRARVARGFSAAAGSYQRWAEAMLGRNVPMTARDAVLETIKRKAPFATGHHKNVTLKSVSIEELFRRGTAGHETLLSYLSTSGWVRPGFPDASRFLTHLLSIDGPMFDVFTAIERQELREWVAALGDYNQVAPLRPAPVQLAGRYECPQDPQALDQRAAVTYGSMPKRELFYRMANADRFPSARIAAKELVRQIVRQIESAFATDPRLQKHTAPQWSDRVPVDLVRERHVTNVRNHGRMSSGGTPLATKRPPILLAFDGVWLQGFADVTRAHYEEYGWLFRIYASEQGDGRIEWNHNRIGRRSWSHAGERGMPAMIQRVMLPATDREFYDFCNVVQHTAFLLAASLHTREFLPELLGVNLGIEATGVCGSYVDSWKAVRPDQNRWTALYFRLHNSIDNYIDGHTNWSVRAVQSFMSRVSDSAPTATQTQWERIWRMWRVQEIAEHGDEDERRALYEAARFERSAAPVP